MNAETVKYCLNCQPTCLGETYVKRFLNRKYSYICLQLMINKGVCRAAPATPGLLITVLNIVSKKAQQNIKMLSKAVVVFHPTSMIYNLKRFT